MKLLVLSSDLRREFKRMLKQYDEFHVAVAWASNSERCIPGCTLLPTGIVAGGPDLRNDQQ
jgi:hypothetical protein